MTSILNGMGKEKSLGLSAAITGPLLFRKSLSLRDAQVWPDLATAQQGGGMLPKQQVGRKLIRGNFSRGNPSALKSVRAGGF